MLPERQLSCSSMEVLADRSWPKAVGRVGVVLGAQRSESLTEGQDSCAHGGGFESARAGRFESILGGRIRSIPGGRFESGIGGGFDRIRTCHVSFQPSLWLPLYLSSSLVVEPFPRATTAHPRRDGGRSVGG